MKKLDEILEPIKIPDNIITRPCTDEEPFIYIPADKAYIEILGNKIDTEEPFKGFEDFCKWLQSNKEVKEENEQLKKQIAEFGEYILTKYEEAKLDAQYIDGTRIPNIQERIYEDILNRMELN